MYRHKGLYKMLSYFANLLLRIDLKIPRYLKSPIALTIKMIPQKILPPLTTLSVTGNEIISPWASNKKLKAMSPNETIIQSTFLGRNNSSPEAILGNELINPFVPPNAQLKCIIPMENKRNTEV